MTRPMRGVALAGGGPLGAIYEIGALIALEEALCGFDLVDCDVYVGVSAGALIAAGLANGLGPRTMHRSFIESETADDPFEPALLLRPAIGEYGRRLAAWPALLLWTLRDYLEHRSSRGFFESFQRLARVAPAGLFDNNGMGAYLARLFSAPGRTNDFRRLRHKLFLVATDLDTAQAVPFGAPGWDDVPIARAAQASAALPGVFPPVEIAGRYYVDGALTKTLHASVALREGVKLLVCVNPLVPFNAELAARHAHKPRVSLVEGGLPVVLAQTFRSLVYSRMQVGMGRYRKEFPGADVLLFQPGLDDAVMFSTNVFSYSGRRRLCEHAYQKTRDDLKRRSGELEPILARHGLAIDRAVLADKHRTLLGRNAVHRHHAGRPGQTARQLSDALDRLDEALRARIPLA
jgi:NTE family protein